MWIWIAAVVLGLAILVGVAVPLVGRLGGLQRAVLRLQRRQQEALSLQASVAELEQTMLGLQQRAEATQAGLAVIKAGRGEQAGRHVWP